MSSTTVAAALAGAGPSLLIMAVRSGQLDENLQRLNPPPANLVLAFVKSSKASAVFLPPFAMSSIGFAGGFARIWGQSQETVTNGT